MPCATRSFAPSTVPASHAKAGTRVAVGPRVPAGPARGATDGFRKYLPARRFGASRVMRVASARDTSGGFAGHALRLHEDTTTTSSEAAGRARASAPHAHRFASASAVWRRVRNVFVALCAALAFACVAAAPAAAFQAPLRGAASSHASYAYSSAMFPGQPRAEPGFVGVGDSPSSVYAMKNLPVAVGDVGSIGMLGSPAGIGIPYHGKNPGIALFMASGGVAVRMLVNVVVIYAIHKYWMGGDQ